MKKIIVPALPDDQDMVHLLQSLVDAGPGGFSAALDLDVSHIDPLAQVFRVAITAVEQDADRLLIFYEAHYRLFDGCRGVDLTDLRRLVARGVRVEDGWAFDEFVLPTAP